MHAGFYARVSRVFEAGSRYSPTDAGWSEVEEKSSSGHGFRPRIYYTIRADRQPTAVAAIAAIAAKSRAAGVRSGFGRRARPIQ